MKYDTLLFDADGTLLDFDRSEHEAFFNTLSRHGIKPNDCIASTYNKINESLWKQLERGEITKPVLKVRRFSELAEMYGFDYDPAAVAGTYVEELSGKSYILGNAYEVCRKLGELCRMYIITNGFKVIQQGRLMNTELYKFFDGAFISEDVGFDKPSPQYFEAVEKAVPHYNRSSTLVIGDSLTSDIQGGINAGLDVCWFNPKRKEKPADMKINYIIGDLAEVYDIIKQ